MASPIQLKNNAVGRLTSGVSSSDTTLTLVSGDGAKFPTLTGAQYFPATLIRASDSAVEIVKVTARSGDVLTVVRAQEGTTGLAFSAGDRIELRMTAQTLLDQVTDTISSFGVGNTATVAWTSPDDWTKATGTYIVTAANFPTHPFPGNSTDCVVMHSRSTSTANQIAFIADSGVSVVRVATRRWGGGSGGSWSTWREIYHSGNIGAATSKLEFTQSGPGAVATTVQAKLRECVSVSDYSSAAAAVGNITTSGLIHVPNGGTTTPISADGKNILWEYDQGGDSGNVLDLNGTRGGFFADYDCKAGKVLVYQVRENQSSIPGGGFRDLIFLNVVDNDTADYTTVGQKVTYGLRSYVQGAYVSGNYQPQYKDLVGGEFYAIGNIQWDDRGCSGITAAAIQYGSGIASNEFSVQNPPSGPAGGVEQSLSMAAVQPIIRAQFADEDATHKVRGVLVSNVGRRATAGVELLSSTAEGYSGHYKRAIEMGGAVVTDAAIYMPQSASGNAGTIIVYDPNDYSIFDRENNRFGWVVGGVQNLTVSEKGVGVGLAIASTAQTRLQINSSTSALSHLQLIAGSTPSAPNNGEIWFDGSALKIVIGGVVRTVTVT